jgi:hypothetical protein
MGREINFVVPFAPFVMAGLGPAIHATGSFREEKRWSV